MAAVALSLGLAFASVTGAHAETSVSSTGECLGSNVPSVDLTSEYLVGFSETELNQIGFTRDADAHDNLTPIGWLAKSDVGDCATQNQAAACSGSFNLPSQSICTNIWSGYIVGSPTNRFSTVTGHLIVPAVSYTCPTSSYGGWVGLGGYHTTSLLQAGVYYLQSNNGPKLFYEYINGALDSYVVNLGTPGVKAGDDVQITVAWSPGLSGAIFTFTNFTQQHATNSKLVFGLPATYFDGTTAEWIDERLTISGTPSPLANYDMATWSQAKVMITDTGQYSDMTSEEQRPLGMTSGSNTLLSYPTGGATSSTSFTDHYFTCGA